MVQCPRPCRARSTQRGEAMPISPGVRDAIRQGSWIRKMFEEGALLKAAKGQDNVFDFSLGNPYGEPPDELAKEILRLSSSPPPAPHPQNPGLPFAPDHVVMSRGAAGALNVALRAILSPGDEVLIIAPYFVEYLYYIRNAGGIPVVAESAEDFQLDMGAIRAALSDRTKAVILNRPNNPAGAVHPRDAL